MYCNAFLWEVNRKYKIYIFYMFLFFGRLELCFKCVITTRTKKAQITKFDTNCVLKIIIHISKISSVHILLFWRYLTICLGGHFVPPVYVDELNQDDSIPFR